MTIAHASPSGLAMVQTVGQKDGFQRCYPDRASAETAFRLFEDEKVYPDYGKAPWVVYLGRRIGVITKMCAFVVLVKA